MNRPLVMDGADAFARTAGRRAIASSPSRPSPMLSSDQLLAGARELVIRHEGGQYFLRLTRNNKLILTK